jgi:hypothetical protein
MSQLSTRLTVAIDLWSWAETLRDIDRGAVSFGVRQQSRTTRWRGLSIELCLDVTGTPDQVERFAHYLATVSRSIRPRVPLGDTGVSAPV